MRRVTLAALLAAVALQARAAPAQGTGAEVDVALVLAVDVSLSMTGEEQRIQREGYVAAFRSEAAPAARVLPAQAFSPARCAAAGRSGGYGSDP